MKLFEFCHFDEKYNGKVLSNKNSFAPFYGAYFGMCFVFLSVFIIQYSRTTKALESQNYFPEKRKKDTKNNSNK